MPGSRLGVTTPTFPQWLHPSYRSFITLSCVHDSGDEKSCQPFIKNLCVPKPLLRQNRANQLRVIKER